MKTLSRLEEWQAIRAGLDERKKGCSIGLVPTMGALHQGHASLLQRSLDDNEVTVASIYINPTQFDKASDLSTYPRQLDQDLALLKQLGVDFAFLPRYTDLYPDDFRYRVSETDFSRALCGAYRPGHFDGMLTVVLKLLQIIRPNKAYFGEKDYQQLELIRGLVEAFFVPVEIVACPIVRENDGLATSSRNQLLDLRQRQKAALLYRILRNSTDPGHAIRQLQQQGFEVDYVEEIKGRRLAAARLGNTRLIDNVPIE